MLCAHTVRRLRPGTFDQFVEAFRPDQGGGAPPAGWVRFDLLRDVADPDVVITFGFFDGSLEQLEGNQDRHGYAERLAAIRPFVQEVVLNGVYEVAVELTPERAPA